MNAVPQVTVRGLARFTASLCLVCVAQALPRVASPHDHTHRTPIAHTVKVDLSEWKVQLTPALVPAGPVVFEVTNAGNIPHAFEVEGGRLERSTPQIQPGATTTLKLDLHAGSYEAYCPVGKGSHKMLGMMNHLMVGRAKHSSVMSGMAKGTEGEHEHQEVYAGGRADEAYSGGRAGEDEHDGAKMMKVVGGGPVIQILPGPFPFADSAMTVIQNRPPDQQADLTHKAHLGPYSNNVAKIAGDISLAAIDRGASGDSVSGVAAFTTQDGARWKVVMDRVQTKDIPFNPRFGGVIMGLFYHGASGVHTPLVPTIQSSLALWAFAHLYKNDQLVTDNAMVHVMLLSRTRRTSDWALDCWDCSERPIEELQLQVTAAPNTPPFDAPGGFLFVNWEKSSGVRVSL